MVVVVGVVPVVRVVGLGGVLGIVVRACFLKLSSERFLGLLRGSGGCSGGLLGLARRAPAVALDRGRQLQGRAARFTSRTSTCRSSASTRPAHRAAGAAPPARA